MSNRTKKFWRQREICFLYSDDDSQPSIELCILYHLKASTLIVNRNREKWQVAHFQRIYLSSLIVFWVWKAPVSCKTSCEWKYDVMTQCASTNWHLNLPALELMIGNSAKLGIIKYQVGKMRKYDLWPIFYLFLRYEKHFLAFETEYDGLNEDMQKESEDVHTIQFHIFSLMIKCKNIYPSR